MPNRKRVIGLMSGTSLDGIDAAYLETDGVDQIITGPALTDAYPDEFREKLRGVLGGQASGAEVRRVELELTSLHADAVRALLTQHPLCQPELVGFHGHTILHRPELRRTWQIGDGALLAEQLGLPVVSDFRSADVAAGGQGAPLVPAYHRALADGFEKPVVILNLGGVANLTWIGTNPDDILAFDAGPGNALIDDWALRHTGKIFDEDGALAKAGAADPEIVRRFLAHPYFAATPPKSLDRDDFAHLQPYQLSPSDGAATLVAMTVGAIAHAFTQLPSWPARVLVTGGGRHNPVIMSGLRDRLGIDVLPVESVQWDGDALEAQAFGYLAVRSLAGLPLSFPGTTGITQALTGGRLDRPDV